MSGDKRYSAVIALFATVVYTALVVLAFGLISLYTERDVIAGGVSALVGPTMTGVASVVVLVLLIVIGTTIPAVRQRVAPLSALGVGFAAYLAFIGTGAVLGLAGSFDSGPGAVADSGSGAFDFAGFALAQLLSPFALSVGLIGFGITLCYQLVLHGRFRDRDRPRWPWEDDRSE